MLGIELENYTHFTLVIHLSLPPQQNLCFYRKNFDVILIGKRKFWFFRAARKTWYKSILRWPHSNQANMPEAVLALGRQKLHRDGIWCPYRGSHSKKALIAENTASLDEFEELNDLWYLEFGFRNDWYLALGCVFDIDLKESQQQEIFLATVSKRVDRVREIVAPIIRLLEEEFPPEIAFQVYASGSKGVHIYVKNPDGFLMVSKNPELFTSQLINSYLESRFSKEFLGLIDKSPYPHNKGIRPLQCEHPKTQVLPFLIYQRNWPATPFSEDTWLYWACETISSGLIDRQSTNVFVNGNGASSVKVHPDLLSTRVVNPLVPFSTAPIITEEISVFHDGPLAPWIKLQGGLRSLPEERQQGNYLLYIITDSSSVGGKCWCPIARKIHKTCCTSWDCSFENGVRVASCFNIKCSGKRFVMRLPIENPITMPRKIPEESITLYDNPDNRRYLPVTRLIADIENHKKLVICSPMGSGKTYSIVEWVSRHKQQEDFSVLIIGTRIQQIAAWHSKFTHLGFKNYEEIQGSLFNESRLLICLNSLMRLLGPQDDSRFRPLPKFKAIIIDEADSLARWLGGPLLTESPLIFEILRMLICASPYVLCMDGIPTLALREMLLQFGVLDKFHWIVYQSLKFKRWLFINNHSYFTSSYLSALQSGKRIFFVTNSKTAVFRFFDLAVKEARLDPNKILAIHGEMSRTQRDQSGNPDHWIKYDLILANGSLGPGASFDPRDHFHQVFCLVDVKCGVIPAEIAQLIERPRNLINNQVFVMVLKKPLDEYLVDSSRGAIRVMKSRSIGNYAQSWAIPAWRSLSMNDVYNNHRGNSEPFEIRPEYPIYIYTHLIRDPAFVAAATPVPPSEPVLHQSRLVTLPEFNEETLELENQVSHGAYGLVFEQRPLVKLQSLILQQMNESTTDSENFLEELQKICTLNGAGFTTKGPRTLLDDKGKDRVQGSMMGYLKTLGKRTAETRPVVSSEDGDDTVTVASSSKPSDWEKCQSDPIFIQLDNKFSSSDPRICSGLKKLLYRHNCSVSSRLTRLRSLIRSYNGTDECISQQVARDVIKLFQVPAGSASRATTDKIRPESIARVCYTNKITTGELFAMLHVLLALLNHKLEEDGNMICPQEPFSSLVFYDAGPNRQAWWDAIRACVSVFSKEGYTNTFKRKTLLNNAQVPDEPGKAHGIVFNHLYEIMTFVGLPFTHEVVRKRLLVNAETNERKKRVWHVIRFDKNLYALHKVLLGGFDQQQSSLDEVLAEYFPEIFMTRQEEQSQ